jgi:hypothetical protein
LNPEYKDVVSAQLLNDAVGDGAKKRMAKRRIDMITGNVNSYAKVRNSKEHLNHAIQMNQLASVIGSMKADTDIERAAKAAAKKADDDEKARKREEALEKVHQKKMELQPCLIELAEGLANGSTDLEKITVSKLSELLRYFFEPPIVGLTKMKRPALLAAVQERIEIYKLSRVEA